jgi:hypothetical protein
MFEKREKTPEIPPNCARPSLEAVMALQKMLEDGLLDQLEQTHEAPALEARSSVDGADDHTRRTWQAGTVQNTSWTVGRFFRDLAHKLYYRKKPIGGKSASGSG